MLNPDKIIENSLNYYQERVGKLNAEELENKKEFLKDMAVNPRKPLLNFIARFHNMIFPSLKNVTLSVDASVDLDSLNAVKKPVVYIPNHVSNLDSLILGTQLFLNKYPYPIFAAGENLFTNKLSSYLLRSCGAFKLKREITKQDKDYMKLIGSYLRANLEENVPTAIFAEGTRSRSGRLKEFKRGLISLVLDSYFKNQAEENPKIEDIIFVPVGIAYTKVPEDTYFLEDKGSKAQRKDLVKELLMVRKDLHPVYMNIGKPISAKEFFGEYIPSEEELISSISKDFASYLRLQVRMTIPILYDDIIHHAIDGLIEEGKTDTIHLEKLKERVRHIMSSIKDYGHNIVSTKETIEDFLSKMHNKRLLRKEERKITIKNKGLLKYYANKLTSFYKKE